jgi:hypothetical protein
MVEKSLRRTRRRWERNILIVRVSYLIKFLRSEIDGSGSASFPMAGFDISDVVPGVILG